MLNKTKKFYSNFREIPVYKYPLHFIQAFRGGKSQMYNPLHFIQAFWGWVFDVLTMNIQYE